MIDHITTTDPEIAAALRAELARERDGLEMIPSENFVSPAVMEALGSVLTNKYQKATRKRYMAATPTLMSLKSWLAHSQGALRRDARERSTILWFTGLHGSLFFLLSPRQAEGMNLLYGGHLTHGWKINFRASSTMQCNIQRPRRIIDYDEIEAMAVLEQPKLIFVGATAPSVV